MNTNMINCPSCQKSISSNARTCPSCGEILSKPERGVFGKIVLWIFWGFNILMALSLYTGLQDALESQQDLYGAEAAGAAIGTGLGVTFLIIIWGLGAIVFGLMALLTRPK